MNPPNYGKIVRQTDSSTLVWLVLLKENSEFKPVELYLKLTLCRILLVQKGM